jgi:hypothetical protein
MIARCTHNSGADLGTPGRGHFYSAQTVFYLRVGSTYPVLRMGIWETVLLVLVCDETRTPTWLPIGLFDFDSQSVPADWEFALLDAKAASGGEYVSRWVALWGYSELVRDTAHSDALMEGDPAAVDVFFRELLKMQGGRTPQQT